MWTKNSCKMLGLRVTLYRHSLRSHLRKMETKKLRTFYINVNTRPNDFSFSENWQRKILLDELIKEYDKRVKSYD